MATATAPSQASAEARPLPGRRYDHRYFSLMAILVLVTVFIGFGPTYYWAGVFEAALPSPVIHVHGAVFSCWVLLLLVQTSLVSARRVDIHRRLGVAGFFVAGLMVILGLCAALNALVNHRTRGELDPRVFFVVPFTDILTFAGLIFFAMWYRKNSAAHKRLVLLATVALLTAAFARFHVGFLGGNIVHAMFMSDLFVIALAAYDYWSTRTIQRATLLGGLFLVVVQYGRLPLSQTTGWMHFASWMQAHTGWLK